MSTYDDEGLDEVIKKLTPGMLEVFRESTEWKPWFRDGRSRSAFEKRGFVTPNIQRDWTMLGEHIYRRLQETGVVRVS